MGKTLNMADQVPDDNPSFFKEYYHNHRVLQHGNLTGMVHFRCSISWTKIK
jgi:beta-glucosidase/6-phospho-beta-glucosidase/beta-galactosidase